MGLFISWGGWCLARGERFGTVRTAKWLLLAVTMVCPTFPPSFFLGIPITLFTFIALRDPEVRATFPDVYVSRGTALPANSIHRVRE